MTNIHDFRKPVEKHYSELHRAVEETKEQHGELEKKELVKRSLRSLAELDPLARSNPLG